MLGSSFFWTYMKGSKTVRSSRRMYHSTDKSRGAMSSSHSYNLITSMRYTRRSMSPCVDYHRVSTSSATSIEVIPSTAQHSVNKLVVHLERLVVASYQRVGESDKLLDFNMLKTIPVVWGPDTLEHFAVGGSVAAFTIDD